MRWKLLIITSLVAAIGGAGGSMALLRFVSCCGLLKPIPLFIIVELLPLATATGVYIFVYRHTARRRKLQAILTVLLSLILIHAALFAGFKLFAPNWYFTFHGSQVWNP